MPSDRASGWDKGLLLWLWSGYIVPEYCVGFKLLIFNSLFNVGLPSNTIELFK